MNRRNFIELVGAGSSAMACAPIFTVTAANSQPKHLHKQKAKELNADIVIAGGGLGGCAAALAALKSGLSVILTEETDWVGGQLTQQAVPPDEHQWIESHGATQLYREFRSAIRQYYKSYYPLTEQAKNTKNLNPGNGAVSRLCFEPKVGVTVLESMLAPYTSTGQLTLLLEHKAAAAEVSGDKINFLAVNDLRNGNDKILSAAYFVDATELGDLLPLSGTEYVSGAEAKSETNELHAAEEAQPHNHQSYTMCFAMDYVPGAKLTIDKPEDYNFWHKHIPKLSPPWPGELLSLTYANPSTLEPKELGFHPDGRATGNKLNLWNYRKIIDRHNFKNGLYTGDITIVNWPQNDYMLGNLVDVSEKEFQKHLRGGKQLSLSLFYWLQTEAPRPDGGQGWPGLRLRGDVMGTEDGMAKYPYIRESRRIKAEFTVLEEHVGTANRALITGKKENNTAADFYDSVGIGYYHIDLHPSTAGDNYIDFGSLPFQIPLGALIPQRTINLLPANKNIGTTHITNGCYRLHPVEWSIGEAVGYLVAYSLKNKTIPKGVREDKRRLAEYQSLIRKNGIETHWPKA
ncbi:FAD-dependent oxidoreductase [Porifericola rhodea]|uniref:FAD-dependent oxidoreductase n=1 Tax=Porifericola rhodea TaxID=930972 RepID=UPI0026658E7F|nr:FAD-dependent oxidoreductase [Porifericola rhodea]WKN30836.1 FAD-dependent oxidoreductase [Porifericola rhodea]